jgi:D-alanyl-D-alanine dipeptidase
MVGFMRWAHRDNSLFILAVLLPLVAGTIFGVLEQRSSAPAPQVKVVNYAKFRQCFDVTNLFIYSTKNIECPQGYLFLGDGGLSESATASGVVEELHPQLEERFNTARLFAAEDGISLVITSGFRTLERQAFLYQREVRIRGSESEAAKWVLPPQSSHHPMGLAIDVNYPKDRPGALWLERHGWRFGLCRVYANEWWHFEAVSAPGVKCPPLAPDARVDLAGSQP